MIATMQGFRTWEWRELTGTSIVLRNLQISWPSTLATGFHLIKLPAPPSSPSKDGSTCNSKDYFVEHQQGEDLKNKLPRQQFETTLPELEMRNMIYLHYYQMNLTTRVNGFF